MAEKKHVVVGAGPAGLRAIETIRSYESDSSVTLIGGEPAYSRMVVPHYLAGDIEESAVFTGDSRYFADLKVDARFGAKVTSIDPQGKAVGLDDGSWVEYDDLLIATGSTATRPSIPGAWLPGVQNMWTLDDARAFLSNAKPGSDVAIVGAGFIGLVLLDGLHNAGHNVTFVEREGNILPHMIDAEAAAAVGKWMGRQGVEGITGGNVTEIASKDGRLSVGLGDGRSIEADSVIMATGIRPNVDLAAGSGVEMGQGILVNSKMETNIPGIYAAGDVAEGPVLHSHAKAVHAIQPTAFEHGRIAGANMAGQDLTYAGSLGFNALDAVGLQVVSVGDWHSDADTMTVSSDLTSVYRRLCWSGNVIVGAVMIGSASDVSALNDVGMVKGFIQAGTHLGAWKDYLTERPLDVRKPYVACKVAEGLLRTTLLGKAAIPGGRSRRFPATKPATRRTPWHRMLVSGAPTRAEEEDAPESS